MDKKEQRKELELLLVKTIEDILTKRNANIPSKIRKTTFAASKSISKKFYKTVKELSTAKKSTSIKPTKKKGISKKPKTIVKTSVKKTKTKNQK